MPMPDGTTESQLTLSPQLQKQTALVIPNSHFKTSKTSKAIETIKAIFLKPAAEIDLARTKLIFDKLVDPTINVIALLSEINKMAKTVENGLTKNMKPLGKLLSLSTYLYESGYRNKFQPFQYNFEDPFGQNLNSKLISNYIKTKKGNCISMPLLYLILADKLGLDVTLSTAPLHVFVKFKDAISGKYFNLETTDKGQLVKDDFYQQKTAIKSEAIKNGVYLQPLSKKEIVAVMAILLSEHYAIKKQWQQSIDIAKLILKNHPNYVYAMIKIGNGYSRLLALKIKEARENKGYTAKDKQQMDELYKQNFQWFEKAEKLGWQMPSQQENSNYINSIKQRINSLLIQKKENNDV